MNVQFSDALRQDKKCLVLAEKATELLETDVMVQLAESVEVKWDREVDAQGRPLVSLTLSDWTGTVTANYFPEVMVGENFVVRLYTLWGKLLKIRSHYMLRDLQENVTVES